MAVDADDVMKQMYKGSRLAYMSKDRVLTVEQKR